MSKEISTGKNKMGIMPVPRLLLTMGTPMIVSMALQALYNIVDSYFVSGMPDTEQIRNMGDLAVNALTLAFPVQMLMVAVCVGTGVGLNALLSKSLGAGDRQGASAIAGNSIFLSLCTFGVYLLFGLLGVPAFIRTQTHDPAAAELAVTYLRICSVGSFGLTMQLTYEKLLQATGRTMQTTVAQISGAAVNIVLDPVMIFGLAGCPALGIAGAAYATIIGQYVSMFLNVLFFYRHARAELDTSLRFLRPRLRVIREIYQVGIPAILMQALMSFMTYGVNIILRDVSAAAVTAYGMYYKIQQFVCFAAFGMNNAMIPVIGFNFGMGSKQRIRQGIRYGQLYEGIIMLIGTLLLQLLANPLVGIFSVSAETQSLCILAIRIISIGYLCMGANIGFQGIFQALGHGVLSLILSLVRLILIALPLAWALTRLDNASRVVWIAFPAAEACALVLGLVLMRRIRRTQLDKLEDTSQEPKTNQEAVL